MMTSTTSSSTTEQPSTTMMADVSSELSTIGLENLETYRNSSSTGEDYLADEYSSEDLDNEA